MASLLSVAARQYRAPAAHNKRPHRAAARRRASQALRERTVASSRSIRPGCRHDGQRDPAREASMADVPITVACGNYDRTARDQDGRVKVDGCALTYLPLYPEEIFHRAFKFQEFDVSELSFSSYIRTVAAGTSAYVGIPGVRVAHLPPLRHLYPQGRRHQHARGPARQAHRRARIPDHGRGLDARHDAARIRRRSRTRSTGATAARSSPAAASARR